MNTTRTIETIRSLMVILLILLVALSCATYEGEVKTRFQNEFECNLDTVSEMGAGTYRVQGCGHTVTYVCSRSPSYTGGEVACIKESETQSFESGNLPGKQVEKKRNDKGETMIFGKFRTKVGKYRAEVRLRGEPSKDSEKIEFDVLIRSFKKRLLSKCELKIVSNGKRVEYIGSEHLETRWDEEIRTIMPLSSLVLFGDGQRVIGRLCDEEFQFTKEAVDIVKEFLIYFEEERALNADQNEVEPSTKKREAQDIIYRENQT